MICIYVNVIKGAMSHKCMRKGQATNIARYMVLKTKYQNAWIRKKKSVNYVNKSLSKGFLHVLWTQVNGKYN